MIITELKFFSDKEHNCFTALINKYKDKSKATKTEYRDSLLLRLAQKTSARECEVLGVRPMDIGKSCVTIFGAKGSNDRTIPIPADLCRELLAYAKENNIPDDARIFPFTTRHFRRIFKKYTPNRKKGAHCMRHTGALKLAQNCKDPRIVQYYLGHKSLANTMVYIDYLIKMAKLRRGMSGMWSQKIA